MTKWPEWKPIASAEKDGRFLLLLWPAVGPFPPMMAVGRWIGNDNYAPHWCRNYDTWTPGDDPTHWMELPDPPRKP